MLLQSITRVFAGMFGVRPDEDEENSISNREVCSQMPPTDYIIIGDTAAEYADKVSEYLTEVLKKELSIPGLVSIGVSGGSMPKLLVPILLKMEWLPWKRIRIFMVDERFVPSDHPDSNFGQYAALLPKHLHDYLVGVEIGDSLTRSAQMYLDKLKTDCQPECIGHRNPRFDIVLLGMGPDGHTASLFPNSKYWRDQDRNVLAVDDSPKPPPKRITLGLSAINHAKNVAFLITGEEKASVVRRVIDQDATLPSSLVRPLNGRLRFFLDKAAASKL